MLVFWLLISLLPALVFAFLLCEGTKDFRDGPVGRIIQMPVDDESDNIPLILITGEVLDKYEGINSRDYPRKIIKHPDKGDYVCPVCGRNVSMEGISRKWQPHYEIEISCKECWFSAIGIIYTSEKLFRIIELQNFRIEAE